MTVTTVRPTVYCNKTAVDDTNSSLQNDPKAVRIREDDSSASGSCGAAGAAGAAGARPTLNERASSNEFGIIQVLPFSTTPAVENTFGCQEMSSLKTNAKSPSAANAEFVKVINVDEFEDIEDENRHGLEAPFPGSSSTPVVVDRSESPEDPEGRASNPSNQRCVDVEAKKDLFLGRILEQERSKSQLAAAERFLVDT